MSDKESFAARSASARNDIVNFWGTTTGLVAACVVAGLIVVAVIAQAIISAIA